MSSRRILSRTNSSTAYSDSDSYSLRECESEPGPLAGRVKVPTANVRGTSSRMTECTRSWIARATGMWWKFFCTSTTRFTGRAMAVEVKMGVRVKIEAGAGRM